MKSLERKLYKSITKAVKPREHDEHLKDIQSKTKIGQGRHAVRVLASTIGIAVLAFEWPSFLNPAWWAVLFAVAGVRAAVSQSV